MNGVITENDKKLIQGYLEDLSKPNPYIGTSSPKKEEETLNYQELFLEEQRRTNALLEDQKKRSNNRRIAFLLFIFGMICFVLAHRL